MSILDGKEIEPSTPPSERDLEAEAEAWGFKSWEQFMTVMEEEFKDQD